jgi:hypothetical protein
MKNKKLFLLKTLYINKTFLNKKYIFFKDRQ